MSQKTKTLTEEFTKPPATKPQLETEKQDNLDLGAISSEILEYPDKFILVSVWPRG